MAKTLAEGRRPGSGRPPGMSRMFDAPQQNRQFSEGQKSKGILDDYAERQAVSAKEYAGVKLNFLENPDGNLDLNVSNKLLGFRYTAPTPAGDFSGAFEIEATGGFTGDLVHIHQHTGNPGATRLLALESADTDVIPFRILDGAAGILFQVDGAGYVTLGGELDAGAHTIGFTQQSATGDGTTTIDWKLGNKFKFTFGAQNDTFTFTAPTNPCNILLVLIQDGTGSRLATWPATVKWPAATAPTLTTAAAAIDVIAFYFDGTNYYGESSLAFG